MSSDAVAPGEVQLGWTIRGRETAAMPLSRDGAARVVHRQYVVRVASALLAVGLRCSCSR